MRMGDNIIPDMPKRDKDMIIADSIVKAETPNVSPVIFGSR
jgi:hypothetical protein